MCLSLWSIPSMGMHLRIRLGPYMLLTRNERFDKEKMASSNALLGYCWASLSNAKPPSLVAPTWPIEFESHSAATICAWKFGWSRSQLVKIDPLGSTMSTARWLRMTSTTLLTMAWGGPGLAPGLADGPDACGYCSTMDLTARDP